MYLFRVSRALFLYHASVLPFTLLGSLPSTPTNRKRPDSFAAWLFPSSTLRLASPGCKWLSAGSMIEAGKQGYLGNRIEPSDVVEGHVRAERA
jgi:hypothetical protein